MGRGMWDMRRDAGRDAGRDTRQDARRDAGRNWQHFFFPIISCHRTSFPVLECTFSVLECLSCFRTSFSVLELPFLQGLFPVFFLWGGSDFVPGFLLLPLFQDKGTARQGNIFVSGCPVPWKP